MGLSAQNTIKMKREVRRIHWYTTEKEKTNDTKVINNTISLGFQRQSHKSQRQRQSHKRLQSRKVGQMFNISRAKSGKLKSQKVPSLLGKQRQSGNIRFTVGQYSLIIKRTGTNYVK